MSLGGISPGKGLRRHKISWFEVHDHILNSGVFRDERSLHFVANPVSFQNRRRWIDFDVKLDEQADPALSKKTFFDALHSRLGGCDRGNW